MTPHPAHPAPTDAEGRERNMGDWFDGGGSGKPCDVGALMDSDCYGWLCNIVGAGALVSLGTTGDGGALAVTVTVDGRWRREYFRDSEALVGWLAEAANAVTDAIASPTASSGRRERPRRSRGL